MLKYKDNWLLIFDFFLKETNCYFLHTDHHRVFLFFLNDTKYRHECLYARVDDGGMEEKGDGDVKLVGDITNEPFDRLIQ